MNFTNQIVSFLLLTILHCSCMLESESSIVFPEAKDDIMLECYLIPNNNYQLLLMGANDLNQEIVLDLIWRSKVSIETDQEVIPLLNILNTESETGYVFNYGSPKLVDSEYTGVYTLHVKTVEGVQITANTHAVSVIPINSYEEKEKELLIRFNAPEEKSDRYFTIYAEGIKEGKNALIKRNIYGEDWEKGEVEVILKANFSEWDSLKVKLIHIEKETYDFLESKRKAYTANLDPFTVPTSIKSSISGALGVFACYAIDSVLIR